MLGRPRAFVNKPAPGTPAGGGAQPGAEVGQSTM